MATLRPEQVAIVKSTVPILRQHGKAITSHFYRTMLQENPNLNSVFNQANQADNHQANALASALYAYAANLDDLGVLSPAVEKICQKHASLHIRPQQYEIVGKYLLGAMAEVLGAALTAEVLEAWTVAYWQLARILIGREEQLYQQTDGWSDWRDLRIARKVPESDEITSFYLEPADGDRLRGFHPGQYISVAVEVPRLQHAQSRQYSLSDAPGLEYYRISVKKEAGVDAAQPGCVSNILHRDKQVGDVLQVSHPHGDFFLETAAAAESPLVLLSAGVGVTPMLSMVNTATALDSKAPISFVHAARSNASRAFYPHLRELAAQHSNLRYTTFVKEADVTPTDSTVPGRLSLEKLHPEDDLILHSDSTEYFICGPAGFMAEMEAGLLRMGVRQSRIHVEVFGTGMPARG